jgi:hypothetical protein
MIMSCILVTRQDIDTNLVFSVFTSRPISLLVSIRVCVQVRTTTHRHYRHQFHGGKNPSFKKLTVARLDTKFPALYGTRTADYRAQNSPPEPDLPSQHLNILFVIRRNGKYNPSSCRYVKPALMYFLNIGYLHRQWREILNNRFLSHYSPFTVKLYASRPSPCFF